MSLAGGRPDPLLSMLGAKPLLHFVAEGVWSDEIVLAKVREMVLPAIE